jgi:PAS domain S-box-containing protein
MADNAEVDVAEMEVALAAGSPQRVGWFRLYFDDERWEWSPEVARMHGYRPGAVTPTTELVLSHKHPEDRQQVAATLGDILHNRSAFSTRHRIIDTGGAVHHVVVVGDLLSDDDGTVIGTHGFYVDVTPSERARQDAISAAVEEIADNRAGIEHAKGMLMLIYGLTEDAAFELLRWLSQQHNVKLRRLAEQIVIDFTAADRSALAKAQPMFDQLLLTTHRRAAGGPE